MITNNGKEIISKFLLNQVPAYATHLSIGCGATPLDANDSLPNTIYSKNQMDFEMTRVPISSKGFVDDSEVFSVSAKQLLSNVAILTTSTSHNIIPGETVVVSNVDATFNGQYTVTAIGPNASPPYTTFSYQKISSNVDPQVAVSPHGTVIVSRTKMSLTAELPTDNRYEITEVGIWSAANNNLAGQYDSRIIFNFAQSWLTHNDSISDPPLNTNLGFNGTTVTTDIQETSTAFYANTNDALFQTNTRKDRKEGPRYLNKTLLVRGDLSTISPVNGGAWSASNINGDWVGEGTHIHLNNVNFDITGNNTSDLLKLAFSVIDKTAVGSSIDNIKILMEFYKTELDITTGYAKAQIYVPGNSYINDNRYYVANFGISQNIDYSNYNPSTGYAQTLNNPYIRFYASSDFSSSQVRVCRIFVSITASSVPSINHYACFDGFRIDNTTENPIYKMSGYSIIKKDGYPIIKSANTNNYIDFRFSLGIS